MLRSCYSTEMKFYTGTDQTCTVDWYFVDDNTPFIPFWTGFRSRNWDNDGDGWDDQLGEVYGSPRTWRNGSRVGDAAGVQACGTADQWRNGQPLPPATPTPVDAFNTPTCCPVLASVFQTGACINCPKGAWSEWRVVASGFGGSPSLAPLNGTWRLKYIGSCTWEAPRVLIPDVGVTVRWRAIFNPVGELNVFALPDAGPSFAVYKILLATDCLKGRRPPFNSQAFAGSVCPLFITFTPGVLTMPPIGTLVLFAGSVLPAQFLPANGAAVSRSTYPDLFSAIGTAYGAGDGVHTFNVPNAAALPTVAPAAWCIVALPVV